MKRKIGAIVVLLALAAGGLWAQGDRGLITGSVKDASGAVVPGAQVTAIHLATKTSYKTSTTASGDFTVPSLPVGNYQVRVENTGFKTHVANDLVVAAGATVRLDVSLELGATQQTIEVAANAAVVDDGHGPGGYRGLQPAGGQPAADRERRGAQPLRSGNHHGRSSRQRGLQPPDRRRQDRRFRRDAGRHCGHGRTP